MSDPYVLDKSQSKRLQKLADKAGRNPSQVLAWVLKDGFEYTEWFVDQVRAGLADLDEGRSISWEDLEASLKARRGLKPSERGSPAR